MPTETVTLELDRHGLKLPADVKAKEVHRPDGTVSGYTYEKNGTKIDPVFKLPDNHSQKGAEVEVSAVFPNGYINQFALKNAPAASRTGPNLAILDPNRSPSLNYTPDGKPKLPANVKATRQADGSVKVTWGGVELDNKFMDRDGKTVAVTNVNENGDITVRATVALEPRPVTRPAPTPPAASATGPAALPANPGPATPPPAGAGQPTAPQAGAAPAAGSVLAALTGTAVANARKTDAPAGKETPGGTPVGTQPAPVRIQLVKKKLTGVDGKETGEETEVLPDGLKVAMKDGAPELSDKGKVVLQKPDGTKITDYDLYDVDNQKIDINPKNVDKEGNPKTFKYAPEPEPGADAAAVEGKKDKGDGVGNWFARNSGWVGAIAGLMAGIAMGGLTIEGLLIGALLSLMFALAAPMLTNAFLGDGAPNHGLASGSHLGRAKVVEMGKDVGMPDGHSHGVMIHRDDPYAQDLVYAGSKSEDGKTFSLQAIYVKVGDKYVLEHDFKDQPLIYSASPGPNGVPGFDGTYVDLDAHAAEIKRAVNGKIHTGQEWTNRGVPAADQLLGKNADKQIMRVVDHDNGKIVFLEGKMEGSEFQYTRAFMLGENKWKEAEGSIEFNNGKPDPEKMKQAVDQVKPDKQQSNAADLKPGKDEQAKREEKKADKEEPKRDKDSLAAATQKFRNSDKKEDTFSPGDEPTPGNVPLVAVGKRAPSVGGPVA